MAFSSFEAVFFTAAFLVPGFVWSAVLSMLVPSKGVGGQVRFVELLSLSCINHGLWSWALFPLFTTGFLEQNPYWSGLVLFGIMFVSPVCAWPVVGVAAAERIYGGVSWIVGVANGSSDPPRLGLAFQPLETVLGSGDTKGRLTPIRIVPLAFICSKRSGASRLVFGSTISTVGGRPVGTRGGHCRCADHGRPDCCGRVS